LEGFVVLVLDITARGSFMPSAKLLYIPLLIFSFAMSSCTNLEQKNASPPISDQINNIVTDTAKISGLMQWCGMDWGRNSFLPMMKHFRKPELAMTGDQLAYIGVFHGAIQEITFQEQLDSKRTCNDLIRKDLLNKQAALMASLQTKN
jgi:hypothetical protein